MDGDYCRKLYVDLKSQIPLWKIRRGGAKKGQFMDYKDWMEVFSPGIYSSILIKPGYVVSIWFLSQAPMLRIR